MQQNNNKRIEFIDSLRGFTMLLVVLGHLEVYSFEEQAFLWTPIYKFFRMPLFFFISGFIAYKSDKIWDRCTFLKECIKKTRIQLIPTIFFGLIFTYFVANETTITFINDVSKQGYWFTIALLNMFLIYYIGNYILYKLQKNNNDIFISAALLLSIVFVYFIKFVANCNETVKYLMDITCFYYLPLYFPHFVFGILAAKYKLYFKTMLNNSIFLAFVLIIFSLTLGFRNIINENIIGGKEISAAILSFTRIIIVFNFFRKYQSIFSKNTSLGQILQHIGKRTLDIYLLHYFFLPFVPKINLIFSNSPNLIMELFGFVIALIIIAVCLLFSNIIRLSDLLGYWLFGAKNKNK